MLNWLRWLKTGPPEDSEWHRIAGLPVSGARGINHVSVGADRIFQRIKLRCLGSDIDVDQWILEFHEGTILDLSVNCLVEGSESQPVTIGGKRLKRVIVKFDGTRVRRRGRLEIWAQA
jgi:hypothetical protein